MRVRVRVRVCVRVRVRVCVRVRVHACIYVCMVDGCLPMIVLIVYMHDAAGVEESHHVATDDPIRSHECAGNLHHWLWLHRCAFMLSLRAPP